MPNDTDPTTGYDSLARDAADLDPETSPWGDGHGQRHCAWPATRAALPPLSGRRVLLAGCGRGDHVEHFLDRGATVAGGYYERPRAMTTEDVAAAMGVGRRTAAEHLRKAERQVLTALVPSDGGR